MSQNAEVILDHFKLFREPEYTEMLEAKKVNFEFPVPVEDVQKISDWTKCWEYR